MQLRPEATDFTLRKNNAVMVKSIFAQEVRIRCLCHQMFEDEAAASLKEVICFTQPGDKDALSFNLDYSQLCKLSRLDAII